MARLDLGLGDWLGRGSDRRRGRVEFLSVHVQDVFKSGSKRARLGELLGLSRLSLVLGDGSPRWLAAASSAPTTRRVVQSHRTCTSRDAGAASPKVNAGRPRAN